MEIRIRETGEVVSEKEFRLRNPDASFPRQLTEEALDAVGADPVFEGAQAQTTSPYEFSQRSGVEQIDGKWCVRYIVGPVFSDRTDRNGDFISADAQRAKWIASKDASAAEAARKHRNRLLENCDWTQLPDAPLSVEQKNSWAVYRQSLRDISEQSGFPWNVEWPTEP